MSLEISQTELDKAYLSLTDDQKLVLDNHVKRGKKTKWLNAWAKKKGSILSEGELDDPEKTMDKLLEWVLVDYEESSSVNTNTKCECGRPLKYRYTVLHKETEKIYWLGIEHLKQHTGLSPDMVRLITKGLKEIDLERDEILTKVIDGWEFPNKIPKDLDIPHDINNQISVGLPLLDRQLVRLNKLIAQYNNAKMRQKLSLEMEKSTKASNNLQIGFEITKPSYGKSSFIKDNAEKDMRTNNQYARPIYMSDVQITQTYNKLKTASINAQEARDFFHYMRHHKDAIRRLGVKSEELKKELNKALGRISHTETRKWLVEIEYLHC
jgi:hypothetical protein